MRLIDADVMLETLKRKYPEWYTGKPKDNLKHYACLVYYWAVREAPTIDAVPREDYEELERHFVNWEPVVRCKDCKWWQPSEYGVVEQPYCKHLGYKEETGLDIQIGNENDYCSFGERKDDE